ncbi:MAG: hypothetical protein AB8G77_03165 [Rhodothermales bacterium]
MNYLKNFVILVYILCAGITKNVSAADLEIPLPTNDKMIEILLDKSVYDTAKNASEKQLEIQRAQEIARKALKQKHDKKPEVIENELSDAILNTYNYYVDGAETGVSVALDPTTGEGWVNVFDRSGQDRLPLDITIPTVTDFDNSEFDYDDDIFAGEANNIEVLEETPRNKKTAVVIPKADPDYEPIILTKDDFSKIVGQIDGFWKVGDETWHIQVGETKAGDVLASRAEVFDRLDLVKEELRKTERSSKIHIWTNLKDPTEIVRQKRFKRLDIEEWNYDGAQIPKDRQEQIDSLKKQADALTAMSSKNPEDKSLDPAGFGALPYQGGHSVEISSISGDCTYSMTSAYFDGRTLGAEVSLDKLCELNEVFPDTIKSLLLSGGYDRTVLTMLRVTKEPRSGELIMKGRFWTRFVSHDSAGTEIKSVSEQRDEKAVTGLRLTPLLPTEEELCDGQFCNGNSCEYNSYLMGDLLTKEKIYEQYLDALYAEENAVAQLYDTQLGNSKRSAARLEAARHAAYMIGTLDEVVGALTELQGLAAIALNPAALADPVTFWETAKDINSLINRLENAYTDLDKNVESVRYKLDPSKKTDSEIFDAKSQDDIVNLKGWEDWLIDNYPNSASALPDALTKTKIDVSGLGETNFVDALKLMQDQHKKNTSNIADARAFDDVRKNLIKLAKKETLQDQAQSLLNRARVLIEETKPGPENAKARQQLQKIMNQRKEILKQAAGTEVNNTAKRDASFAAAQIGLRLVKTYSLEPKLKEMRRQILEYRNQIPQVADNALKRGEDLKQVRLNIHEMENKLKITKQALSELRPCFSKNCASHYSSISSQTLPDLETRNGNIAFSMVKNRLDKQLEILKLESVQAQEKEKNRDKICPASKNLVADFGTLNDNVADASNEPICTECKKHAVKVSGLKQEISFLQQRIKVKSNGLDQLDILESERRRLLVNMTNLQKELTTMQKETGYLQSWFYNKSDGRQTRIADLHNDIMSKRTDVIKLKRQIKRLTTHKTEVARMEAEISTKRRQMQNAAEDQYWCEDYYCKK